MYLKLLEKQEQTKPKINRWRERSGLRLMRSRQKKSYTKIPQIKLDSLKELIRLINPHWKI
jgi:hypothetical protein